MPGLTLTQLIADLPRLGTLSPDQRRDATAAIAGLSTAEDAVFSEVIAALAHTDLAALEQAHSPLLGAILDAIWQRCRRRREQTGSVGLTAEWGAKLAAAYLALGRASRHRFQILRALAEGEGAALAAFAELLAADPPEKAEDVLLSFAPLFGRPALDGASLFPRLLDAVQSPVVASAVLDLANYLARRGIVAPHPASGRSRELGVLLSAVVQRLQIVQERGSSPEAAAGDESTGSAAGPSASERAAAARQVADAVPLCIALCDTLGLVGDRTVVGKIRPALELAHRRVQTEAAAALARLGEQEGIDVLKRLTTEPVARLRSIAYLDELGLSEQIPEQQRTPLARAEAQLACWLSEPTQFGFPPAVLELVDRRQLFWPGYEEQQECFLLRYTYPVAAGRLTGIGLAGPATYAVGCDLEDFPPTDIYALYAGSQTEHPEIVLEEAPQWTPAEWRRAEQRLRTDAGEPYANVELIAIGRFFEDLLPVATAVRSGLPGTVVLDGQAAHWYPRGHEHGPLGPREAWWMHTGRKILRTFNPDAA